MKSFIASLAIVALGLGFSATRANAAPLTFEVCESKPALDAGCEFVAEFLWADDLLFGFGPILTVFNQTSGDVEGDLDDVEIALFDSGGTLFDTLVLGLIPLGGQAGTEIFDLFGLDLARVVLSFTLTLGDVVLPFLVELTTDALEGDDGFVSASSFAGVRVEEETPPDGVPEPAALALVALGLGLVIRRRAS